MLIDPNVLRLGLGIVIRHGMWGRVGLIRTDVSEE
jgi:hypothetical protein